MHSRRSAIQTLLQPRSVAVIGASANPTRMSGIIINKLRQFGFKGDVYPVNPNRDEIAGFPCIPDIRELRDTPPDVAVIYVRAEDALVAARHCAEIGVRGLIVLTAGFAEIGEEGRRRQEELAEIVRSHDMALCGPNTAGMANFAYGFVAYGTTGVANVDSFQVGGVALISASGGLGASVLSYCRARKVGMSHLIGIGNEAVTGAADYLDVLVDDPDVTCVLAVLEAIRAPEAFFAAADRARALGKPIIVLKQGRSEVGRRAIQTHTAALGGGVAAFEAACRAHGIVVVRDLVELADCAMLFTRVPPRQSYRLGVVSLPGGGKPLVADSAADRDFELPPLAADTVARLAPILPDIAVAENPLDPTAGFGRDSERLRNGLRAFWTDPSFDIALFYQVATDPEYSVVLAQNVVEVSRELNAPLLAIWESGPGLEDGAWTVLHEAGVPLYTTATACFRSLDLHRQYSRMLAELAGPDDRDHGPLAARGSVDLDGPLTPEDLLDRIGVARPRSRAVCSADEAAQAIAELGGPVALKLLEPALTHKTEAGGVRLNIRDEAAIRAAFDAIAADVARNLDGARAERMLVQEMVSDGVEVIVGVHTDEQFGPMLTVGLGGVFTELLGDVAHRLVPVTRTDVRQMLSELKGVALLRGFRGRPPCDEEALVELILRVSWAAHLLRARKPEFELNPVIVRDRAVGGAVAVDWVLDLAG